MNKRYIEEYLISKTGRVSSTIAKKYNVSVEEVYNIYFETEKGKCKNCNIETEFLSFTRGYRPYCSLSCSSKHKAITGVLKNAQVKAKKTKLERYGDENYNNISQNKATKLVNFGNENYNNTTKRAETKKKKYNDENYNNLEKHKKTCINKYGFENIMQTGLVEVKYQHKDYELPSGKIIKLQGYENLLLDELLLEYNEDEILSRKKDMPELWYITEDNIKHRYFPDFYIPSTETLYEVKSEYTLKCAKVGGIFELKEQSARSEGYEFILKVYN